MQFPVFSTKIEGVTKEFDLNSPAGRHEYFQAKAAKEIEELKTYLDAQSFVSFWLAQKGAGKGTYSKMFAEVIGEERVAHISVGDVVRHVHESVETPDQKEQLFTFLRENYRGVLTIEEAVEALFNRDIQTLLPTEFILALVKREIMQLDGQGIMMDGFPRGLDQISYSLYFREIMNLRDDPDFFVLIEVPESVLDARIKSRAVCPLCQLSRNIRFLPTETVGHDSEKDEFYLVCDNPVCTGKGTQRLVSKEGAELGIEGIRDRLETDAQLIQYTLKLQGVDKILLKNTVPVGQAEELVDKYEITPEFVYSYDTDNKAVKIDKKPWVVIDTDGSDAYSLMAPAVVLSFIKQLHQVLV